MEHWRKVWREGLSPQLSTAGLDALLRALTCNDERLVQGATTSPPALQSLENHAVEGACAIGFCGWQGEGLSTVAEVEEFFARVCKGADAALGELAACRLFLDWVDQTPREQMCGLLLEEVRRALRQRQQNAA
jgi:hypothetical protein